MHESEEVVLWINHLVVGDYTRSMVVPELYSA
jgi:hypothetical protein